MGDNCLNKTLNIPVCLACSKEMIIQRRILRKNMFEFRFNRKKGTQLINAYKSVWINLAGKAYIS